MGRRLGEAQWKQLVEDKAVLARWSSHVAIRQLATGCRPWTGALSGRGHGRFWTGAGGKGTVVVAHRFGYAAIYGVAALLSAEVVAHACDEASCQNPEHWVVCTTQQNTHDWAARRHTPGSPLRDTRGSLGRAMALRAAALNGADLDAVASLGMPLGDELQDYLPGLTSQEEPWLAK